MANRYLLPVYRALYGREFSYSNFEQRMEMQKAIYLLQDMGVPIGDYGFRWYHHGPYSQKLQDDMYYEDGHTYDSLILSQEHAESLQHLYEVIHANQNNYSISNWVECLASLHYLRKNILSFDSSEDDIIYALEERKPHLNSRKTNELAYCLLEGLFA